MRQNNLIKFELNQFYLLLEKYSEAATGGVLKIFRKFHRKTPLLKRDFNTGVFL